jgi:hypothetical protein
MGQNLRANWLATVLALLAAAAGLTVSITRTDQTDQTGVRTKTLTVHVDKSGQPGVQPGTVTVSAPVQAAIQPNLETNLRGETPAGMTQEQIDAAARAAEVIKTTLPPLPTAGATAEVPGCRTEFIHSYSSRHGVRPTIFTLHLTVSHNVPGWADVNAIVNLFAHESASSHFILDNDNPPHCAYIVPLEQKAWTQAAGRSRCTSLRQL